MLKYIKSKPTVTSKVIINFDDLSYLAEELGDRAEDLNNPVLCIGDWDFKLYAYRNEMFDESVLHQYNLPLDYPL